MKTTLKTPSVLAFERKIDPSDALLFSGSINAADDPVSWVPLLVREKSVRGTISNRSKTKANDPAKLVPNIQNPNPQTFDIVTLPHNQDTLKVSFSLRILGGVGTPSACNNAEYQSQLQRQVSNYINNHGLSELSKRYAYNLANGRFLWRNRAGAEQVRIHVRHIPNSKAAKDWWFDALSFSLRNFNSPSEADELVKELALLIARGLSGEQHVLLEISAYVKIGAGQEIFPSQELIPDKKKNGKSRTLYNLNNVAAIHSQKLGNAIRTIDTWHPAGDGVGPIAVEPYGAVTTLGKAFRQPKDNADFYSLLDTWVLEGKQIPIEDQHYVIAVIIRGGVFGE